MTGGQAGFVSDEAWGDAKILEFDLTNVTGGSSMPASFRSLPVSKACLTNGAVTLRSDAGAAIYRDRAGRCAGRPRGVEIYTDVSGVMTATQVELQGRTPSNG